MADPVSFLNLLEQDQQIEYLLSLPEMNEDEKAELQYMWQCLKSREESKFDAIIGVIKECDKYIDQSTKEINELIEHWNKFEEQHLMIFADMYQFWVPKTEI